MQNAFYGSGRGGLLHIYPHRHDFSYARTEAGLAGISTYQLHRARKREGWLSYIPAPAVYDRLRQL